MKIDLCFSGWIRGVEIFNAANQDGDFIDTVDMPVKELVDKLNSGELLISLKNCLNQGDDKEISIFNFAETK